MLGRKLPTSINTSYTEELDQECQERRRLLNDGQSKPQHFLRPGHNPSTPQLSPLFQCRATAAGVDYSNDAQQKSYDVEMLDDLKLEEGEPRTQHTTRGSRFDEEQDEWIDPGKGLGRGALACLIVAAFGLMGLLIFMGKAVDAIKGLENANEFWKHPANHSVQSTFPFSPSHYLQDCPSQPMSEEVESTPTSAAMDFAVSQLSSQPTYFQGTYKNKTAYSETDQDGKQICKKSLTYLLDDDFGVSLSSLLLWNCPMLED